MDAACKSEEWKSKQNFLGEIFLEKFEGMERQCRHRRS